MVTVINRPLGHKLTDASVEATVYDSSGEALFITDFAHGLNDGDYIWVQSIIGSYNGYKYVDSIAYNEFKLRESESGDYVPYKQSVSVDYRVSVLQHGWLAISQPIVYELESNLWPNNEPEESYTPRTVASQTDAEGFTQLNLSSPLFSPFALDWIQVVGDGLMAGIYQITRVISPWSVVINLSYSATNSFFGHTIVKYYNNYCINVDVWSGLDVNHPWYSEKPYQLAATLRFTPGADGRVKFSISDILKGYIHTRNNLTLDTLPNNLDFMTGFYIDYYESYDSSDGEEIMTLSSAPTSDRSEFEGHAVNADMPFKSLYVSHMSEYVHEDTYLAKWLTLQETPIAIVGYFFDISFINTLPRVNILINIDKQNNGVVIETTTLDAELDAVLGGSDPDVITYSGVNPGVGIIRVPIIAESGFDQYCIYAYTEGVAASAGPAATSLEALSGFANILGGSWSLGANPVVSVNGNGGVSGWIAGDIPTEAGYDYEFTVEFEIGVTGSSIPTSNVLFALMDIAGIVLDYVGFNYTTAGVKTETFTLNGSGDGLYVSMYVTNNTPFDTKNYDIQSFVYNAVTPPDDSIPAQTITETICIKILEECDNTFIADDDIRLTEDGDFRILE
jgi:hypothetical protein